MPPPLLTTSWDDGHPLDLRVADMLAKHGLSGTFYVPRQAERPTINAAQLRDLASGFEIGAHTLRHPVLTGIPAAQVWQELAGSKSWVEDQTGVPCRMFCPPQGRFRRAHLGMARSAGFIGLRSVELMSLDYPRADGGIMIMPTSLQAYSHRVAAYLRNMAKRAAMRNLWLYVRHGRAGEWATMASRLLDYLEMHGGVFHLWGHSWELENSGQWQRLDDLLRRMGRYADRLPSLNNGQICALAGTADEPTVH